MKCCGSERRVHLVAIIVHINQCILGFIAVFILCVARKKPDGDRNICWDYR